MPPVFRVHQGDESYVMKSLRDYRNNSQLTDVTIVGRNGSLRAHRMVLAAASPFLKHILASPQTEDNLTHWKVLIPNYHRDILAILLNLIYLGFAVIQKHQKAEIFNLLLDVGIRDFEQSCWSEDSDESDCEVLRNDYEDASSVVDPDECRVLEWDSAVDEDDDDCIIIDDDEDDDTTTSLIFEWGREEFGAQESSTEGETVDCDDSNEFPILQAKHLSEDMEADTEGEEEEEDTLEESDLLGDANTNRPLDSELVQVFTSYCVTSEHEEYWSICAVCEGYDPPGEDAVTDWVGCDCGRWFHNRCLIGTIDPLSFSCHTLNISCIDSSSSSSQPGTLYSNYVLGTPRRP